MGCLSSSERGLTEEKANEQIDKHTQKYKQIETIKYKLLLLGAGESGKSTLLKQMRRLHGTPFDASEYLAVKPCLTQNLIEAMRTLAIYSELLSDQGRDTKVEEKNFEIRDEIARMSDKQLFTELHCKKFKQLLSDPSIQKTMDCRSEFQLIDTAEYLFERMDLFWKNDYVPSFEDLIHSRQRTTGVNKIKFALPDSSGALEEIYEIFDVGGQKNERRKWIHFFDNTSAIIFVAALSGYNQLLWEDNRNNRLREAIGLFRGLVNLEAFNDTHVILFLNKVDLFEKKVGKFKVSTYFPDYKGQEDEKAKDEIIEFFKKKFRDQKRGQRNGNNGTGSKGKIYFHVTCATDTNCIKDMFEICREIIIRKELQDFI